MGFFTDLTSKLFGNAETNKPQEETRTNKKTKSINDDYKNGHYSHTTASGKTYDSAWKFRQARKYAERHTSFTDRQKQRMAYLEERKNKNIMNQKLYDLKYSIQNKEDRSFIKRLFGMLEYNGVAQGLYNAATNKDDTNPGELDWSDIKAFGKGLGEGFHYMNPFTDDESGKKYMSDVFEEWGWKDENPDKIENSDLARVGVGLVADILTDPLSFMNGGVVKAGSKIVKGSGYTLDGVRNAAKELKVDAKVSDVAKAFREMTSPDANIQKLKALHKLDDVDIERIGESSMRTLGKEGESAKELGERLLKEYAETIEHINFDKADDITIGLNTLPFMSRRANHLKKTIIKNKTLAELGDRTIAPYANTLFKKIRTSRIGKRFSTRNAEEAKKFSDINEHIKNYALSKMMKAAKRTEQDVEDYNTSYIISDLEKNFTPEELLDWMHAYERGDFKSAEEVEKVKSSLNDYLYQYDLKNGGYIDRSTGEFVDTYENEMLADSLTGDINVQKLSDRGTALNKDVKDAERYYNIIREEIAKVLSNFSNEEREYFKNFTGLSSDNINVNAPISDVVNGVINSINYKKVRNDPSAIEELVNKAKFSKDSEANKIRKELLKGSSNYLKRKALEKSLNSISDFLSDYVPKQYQSRESLELLSDSDLNKLAREKFGDDYENLISENAIKIDENTLDEILFANDTMDDLEEFYMNLETYKKFKDIKSAGLYLTDEQFDRFRKAENYVKKWKKKNPDVAPFLPNSKKEFDNIIENADDLYNPESRVYLIDDILKQQYDSLADGRRLEEETSKLYNKSVNNPKNEKVYNEYLESKERLDGYIDRNFDGDIDKYYETAYLPEELEKPLFYRNNDVQFESKLKKARAEKEAAEKELEKYPNYFQLVDENGITEKGYEKIFNKMSNDEIISALRKRSVMKKFSDNTTVNRLSNALGKFAKRQAAIRSHIFSDEFEIMRGVEKIFYDSKESLAKRVQESSSDIQAPTALDKVEDALVDLEDYALKYGGAEYSKDYKKISNATWKYGTLVDKLKTSEKLKNDVPEDVEKIFNIISDRFEKAGLEEVRVGALDSKQFLNHHGSYLYHIPVEDQRALKSLVEEDANGKYNPNIIGIKRVFSNARKDKHKTIKEINAEDKILTDSLAEIYLARSLQSNQVLYSKDVEKFIKDNFSSNILYKSNPLSKDEKYLDSLLAEPEPGYVRAALHSDIERVLNKGTYDRTKEALGEEFNKLHFEENEELRKIGEDLKAAHDAEMQDNENAYNRILKAFDDKNLTSLDGQEKSYLTDSYGNVFNNDEGLNKMLNANREEFIRKIKATNAKRADFINDKYEALYNEKVVNPLKKIEDSRKAFEEENFDRVYAEKYKEVLDEFVNLSDNPSKFAVEFSPNVAIQKLNAEQTKYLFYRIRDIVEQNKKSVKYKKSEAAISSPHDLFHISENVLDTVNKLSYTQKAAMASNFTRLYDTFIRGYKLANTMFYPGFHIQNAISNAFQSFLSAGEAVANPKNIKTAYDILKGKSPLKKIKINGKEYTYKELQYIMQKQGVVDESFAQADILGRRKNTYFENGLRSTSLQSFKNVDWEDMTGTTLKDNFITGGVKNAYKASTVIGTNVEATQRAVLFIEGLKMGDSVEDAVKRVNKFLFDYGDLTEFEQNVMKRVIPFYTFMRKNIPLELEQLLNNPAPFRNLYKTIEEAQRLSGDDYVPPEHRNEWRDNYIQLGHTGYGIANELPYNQLERLTPRRIAGQTSPLIKMFPELYLNESLYTGMPYGENTGDEIMSYIAGLSTPTSKLVRYMKQSANNDPDAAVNNLSQFLIGHNIDRIKDVTVNENPLYDINTGAYIGKNR